MRNGLVIDEFGNELWYKDDLLHREDGPAIEYIGGTKKWYRNGKLHRFNGPAVEFLSGTKWWYQNGKRHRLDGPAIEWTNGKRWFIYGEEYTEEEFKYQILVMKLSGLV